MSVYNEFMMFWRLFYFGHQGLVAMNDTATHCIIQLAPTAQCSCSREHQQRNEGQNQAFSGPTYGHNDANATKSGVFASIKCSYN